ncbi:MAG: FtsW/RodA/SpoVE family cell cycle protein [Muribaculaceae bacterium]|nr:FtsW/RodA/SpoVE family cell cycle protein [Muribaculaceae bacterium]MDE7080712.1 FtsW/RodA/SpoVE family cell cycle protein [Muribaculaceae bacterium]
MSNSDNILIRETVDGIPVDPAPATARRRRAAKADSAKDEPRERPKADRFIWGIYVALLFISIIELFSASSAEVRGSNVYEPLIRHCIFLGIGLALVIWIQNIHFGYFSRFASTLAILSLGLLVFSTMFGAEINGAQRAIKIAGFTIQPPEIVKLTIVIWLATILGKNQRPGGVSTLAVVKVAVIVVVFAGILWINGLTNTILMMGVSICMFLIGGIQWKKLLAVGAVYAAAALLLGVVKYAGGSSTEFDSAAGNGGIPTEQSSGIGRQETQIGRIKRHFAGVNPSDPIDDFNRQVVFAKMAQANGGVFGQGPGNSRENARLPLAFSDYIYSIVVEDTGFFGGVLLIMFYLLLLARAGSLAYKCNRAFPAFLIMGCAVLIVFQALVHMAIVTGVFPVSGQPLPFISKGGTSIVVMSMAIGIMLSVSRFAVTGSDKKANQDELDALPEDMQAANYANQE